MAAAFYSFDSFAGKFKGAEGEDVEALVETRRLGVDIDRDN